jgi:succinate dehydrogenase hydrophobic anchor subunit
MDWISVLFYLSLSALTALSLFSVLTAIILGYSNRKELFGFEKIVRDNVKIMMVPLWIRYGCLMFLILTIATGIVAL